MCKYWCTHVKHSSVWCQQDASVEGAEVCKAERDLQALDRPAIIEVVNEHVLWTEKGTLEAIKGV